MRTVYFSFVSTVLCLALYSSSCFSDIVWFKTGRSLEGVVVEETPDQIVFKQGPGKMFLEKNLLEKVDYESQEENDRIVSRWKKDHFFADEYVPPGFSDLAEKFRDLVNTRSLMQIEKRRAEAMISKARMARSKGSLLRRQVAQLQEKLIELNPVAKKYVDLRDSLSKQVGNTVSRLNHESMSSSERDELMGQYQTLYDQFARASDIVRQIDGQRRDLSDEMNRLVVEQRKARDEIDEGQAAESRLQGEIHKYVNQIQSFCAVYEERVTPEDREKYAVFFDGISSEIEEMRQSVKTETVPVDRNKNMLLVTALLNNEIEGRFILDTGAGSTTISKAMATRLGIKLKGKPTGVSFLADGSQVPTTYITLDSIKVGTAVRDNVDVCVLDTPPAPGVDGLLGMTFLKYFIVQFADNQVRLIHMD